MHHLPRTTTRKQWHKLWSTYRKMASDSKLATTDPMWLPVWIRSPAPCNFMSVKYKQRYARKSPTTGKWEWQCLGDSMGDPWIKHDAIGTRNLPKEVASCQ